VIKKVLPIIIVVLLVIGGFFFFSRPSKEPAKEALPEAKKPMVASIDELAKEDQPFVSLTSRPDGRELYLKITNIKNFDSLEYELIYLTEGMQRGVSGGPVKLKPGETAFSRDLLLGTCSRSICRYDENVTHGTLTVTFRGEKAYKFIKDFELEKERGMTVVTME